MSGRIDISDEASRAAGNIWKLYVLQGCTGALFAIPVIVIFFQSYGLTLTEIFVLQSIFSLSLLLCEIPSGYLSDAWGRKRTTIVGCAVQLLAYFLYTQVGGFLGFAIAEVLLGIGISLLSGTLEALTYDTLLDLGDTSDYRRIAGRQYFFHFGSEAVVSPLGGILAAALSVRAPFWAMLAPLGIALALACTLHEPARHRLQEARHWSDMWHITVRTLLHNAALRSIIMMHALLSTMTLTLFWFTQAYQRLIGLPLAYFGVMHACIVAAGAMAAAFVPRLERVMDDRVLLMTIGGMVTGSYLLLGLPATFFGLTFFLVGRVAWGFLGPLTTDMINQMTDSHTRATVLSIRPFVGRILFAITSPFLGLLSDRTSIPFTMLVTGVIGGALLAMMFFLMRHIWRDLPV